MKKFVNKLILFLLVVFTAINFIIAPSFINTHYYNDRRSDWPWVVRSVKKSTQKLSSETAYLGCSVGAQIITYDPDNSLVTDAAVSMLGQFVITSNICNNNDIKKIILIATPYALFHAFEHPQTYSYILRLFFDYKNLQYFSGNVYKKMLNHPASFLSVFPFVKASRFYEDIDFFQPTSYAAKGLISDLNLEYLKKLNELALKKNISLKILSPPVCKIFEKQYNGFINLKNQVKENHLEVLFSHYFRNMEFLAQDCFLPDNLHYKQEYINQNRESIKSKIITSDLFTDLPTTKMKDNMTNSAPESLSLEIIIKDWGPRFTNADEVFNRQPDGSAALWFKLKNHTDGTIVYWENTPLNTVSQPPDELVSCIVPKSFFSEKGKYRLRLKDDKKGKKSGIIVFEVGASSRTLQH